MLDSAISNVSNASLSRYSGGPRDTLIALHFAALSMGNRTTEQSLRDVLYPWEQLEKKTPFKGSYGYPGPHDHNPEKSIQQSLRKTLKFNATIPELKALNLNDHHGLSLNDLKETILVHRLSALVAQMNKKTGAGPYYPAQSSKLHRLLAQSTTYLRRLLASNRTEHEAAIRLVATVAPQYLHAATYEHCIASGDVTRLKTLIQEHPRYIETHVGSALLDDLFFQDPTLMDTLLQVAPEGFKNMDFRKCVTHSNQNELLPHILKHKPSIFNSRKNLQTIFNAESDAPLRMLAQHRPTMLTSPLAPNHLDIISIQIIGIHSATPAQAQTITRKLLLLSQETPSLFTDQHLTRAINARSHILRDIIEKALGQSPH